MACPWASVLFAAPRCAHAQSVESDLTPESEALVKDADQYAVPDFGDKTLDSNGIVDEYDRFSRRSKLWYHPRIRLRYETTPDQVRYILVEAHKLLYSHPKVIAESARIRFVEFGAYSLDLDVFAYIDVVDYREFLEAAEDLNLRMMEVVKASGTELAVPAQIQYRIAKESLSDERVRNAEEKVSEWRAGGALYVPRFPAEKIAELKGSLDYPPAGSPGGKSVSR